MGFSRDLSDVFPSLLEQKKPTTTAAVQTSEPVDVGDEGQVRS